MRFSLKKSILSLAALCVFATLNALDYGGALNNYSRIKGKNFSSLKLDQVDDLNLWIKVPLSSSGKMYFIAEGLYEFEYDVASKKAFNRLDLSLLKFSGTWDIKKNTVSLDAGRFIFSDFTGLVVNQAADGIYANLKLPRVNFSLYGGYTGLLNAGFVKMLNHTKDPFTYKTDKIYQLAEKYAIASAAISFPNLFSSQCFLAQAVGTFKLTSKSYNRFYFTAGMNGPIWQSLFYSVSTTFGLQSYDGASFDLANLSKATLSYYFDFKNLALNLGAVYASGEHGPFKAFTGFSKIDAYSSLKEPQYSGILKGNFGASIKPIKSLLLRAGTAVVFDFSSNSPSYKGFEYNLAADWQIFTDVKVGATFMQYFDNEDKDINKVQISLNASITF